MFSLSLRYYHSSCNSHFAVNDECIDIHARREVGGIDGDVGLATFADRKALRLLAVHVVDIDVGSL